MTLATASTSQGDSAGSETEPLLSSPSLTTLKDVGHRTHVYLRVAAAMYSFLVLGILTSTIGVMIPKLETEYQLSDVKVSLIFLINPIGYLSAAALNNFIHLRFGQRGVALIAPIGHLIFTCLASLHPNFYLLLASFAFAGFGTGLFDGAWCAWAGAMENANTVSGFLHGSYSVGAGLGPFLAGTLLSKGQYPWYYWYYVLSGVCLVEAIVLPLAFRYENGKRYRSEKHDTSTQEKTQIVDIMRYRVTWVCAAYFLAYVGTEASISGWIVSFMTRARGASLYFSSLCSSGFWIGMAVGRLSLGVITDTIGIRFGTMIYLATAIGFQLLFSLIPIQWVSLLTVTLLGFFLGPLFPNAIVMLTRLLPRHLHIPAVAFVASVGQIGAALIPFASGALTQALGIQIFQSIIFGLLAITFLLWMCFPKEAAPDAITSDHESQLSDGDE